MKKTYLKVLSVAAITSMLASAAAPVFAANGDFQDLTNGKEYLKADYSKNAAEFNELLAALADHGSQMTFENGGQDYYYQGMLDEITAEMAAGKSIGDAFADAKADPKNVYHSAASITKVSAVNGTITVTMDKDVTGATAADFAVTQKIDSAAATTVTPTVTVNGAVVTLAVTPVVATTADQSVVYSVSYKSGTAVAADAVKVAAIPDTTAPVITLTGSATVNVANGATYTDAGATAKDDRDATVTVTSVIKNSAGTVVSAIDTTVADTYTITYSASDAAGNAATPVTRTVIVAQAPLAVTSVSAINAKQVQVVFNNAVDPVSSQLMANYTIGGATLLANPNGAVLQADGKTVILNTTAALTNFQQYTLSVANVKDTNNNKIATVTSNFTPNDTAVPVVTSVTSKGNTTIVVAFSAPVNNAAFVAPVGVPPVLSYRNILVDKVAVPVASAVATVSADGTKLTLVYNGALTAGDHTVAIAQTGDVNDIVSFNGFKAPAVSNTVTIAPDLSAPTVQSVTANSQTSVTVKFSKAVNVSTAGDLGKFYWNLSNSVGDNAKTADTITKVDDQTWTIAFTSTGKPMPAGNIYFFVNGIVDYSGNKIAGNVATNVYGSTVAVTANATPSIASSSTKNNNTIYINYATPMDPATALNTANYIVKDSTSTLYAVTGAAWVSGTTDQKQVQLTVAAMTSGVYTVTVSNVKDVVGNVMSVASPTVTVTDTSAPALTGGAGVGVSFEGQSMVVNFNRAMAVSGPNSVLNTANYQYTPFGGTLGTLPAGTIITAFNSNKSVLITVPATSALNAADILYIGLLSGSTLSTVADASGNLYYPDAGTSPGAAKAAVNISTAVPLIKIVDASTLKLVLAAGVNNLSTVGAADFTVSIDGGATTFVPTNATLDATDKTSHTIIFTMPSGKTLAPTLAGIPGQIQVTSVAAPALTKDIYAVKITGAISTGAGINATNAIAPTLVSAAYVSPTLISATFSSDLSAGLPALANSIQIVQGTKVLTGNDGGPIQGKLKPAALAGNVVTFTLNAADALDPSQPITLRTVGADFMTATDASGNLLVANTPGVTVASFAATTITVGIANGALAIGDNIVATFNRNLDLSSIVTNWTTGATPQNATMTFNADGTATIAGANVGSFSGFSVSTTGNVPVVLTSTGPTNLTITMGAVAGPVVTANGVVKLTPSSALKSTSGIVAGTYTVGTAAPVDAKPIATSVLLVNKTGGISGTAEAGDKIVITFSEPVTVAGVAAGATVASTAAVGDTTAAGTIAGFGSFATAGNITVLTTGNTVGLSADAKTVTITLGALVAGSTTAPSGVFTPVATANVKDNEGLNKQVDVLSTVTVPTGGF